MEDTKITLITDDGTEVDFFIVDTTKVNDIDYILVYDGTQKEKEYYILKDLSAPADEEALYEMVDDPTELESVGAIFEQLLDDDEF